MVEVFSAVVRPAGRRAQWLPHQFVEAWRQFVDEVAAGYSGTLYEYEDDLSVRDDLQRALDDKALAENPAWSGLRDSIAVSDRRFDELLSRGPTVRQDRGWWHRRLPDQAGREFAEDAARLYGVTVEADF